MTEIKPLECCCNDENLRSLLQADKDTQSITNLVKTVLEACKKEKEYNSLKFTLEDCYDRISYYTSYPKTFIRNMIDYNKSTNQAFNIYDHILLIECINNIYNERNLDQFKNLYNVFTKFQSSKPCYKVTCILDFNSFELKLHTWGYSYKKTKSGQSLLIENPKFRFERFHYLHKIIEYRHTEKQIYFIDERLILRDQIKKFPKTPDSEKLLDQGIVYFYMISTDGYKNGLCTVQKTDRTYQQMFKKWMTEVVLNSIKPSSVIVMENSSLHGWKKKQAITRYHSKKDMVYWLNENSVPCDISMAKPQLYSLIEKCSKENNVCDLDHIFKAHGHDLLYLPTTFTSLTPCTFLWDYLSKMYSPKENSDSIVKDKVLNLINNIHLDQWIQFSERVAELELDIHQFDILAEILIDDFELDESSF